ncbi:neuroblast differentiation-associated protein AHNAK-like [Acanthochromis polyacanthus]|uniref:neuroblast differentiation-associated protein AHNAK-like n=1 Tax=Acanthochromis polyacanthus TaxID=80966 RepID=UPI0022345482|nr:neuroblast differentiation-associated protein AHNAK-like [Acanthochromis polyacanthus]
MPKFSMPSFGFKGPKVEGPDVDVSLPKADIDIPAPELNVKGPNIDIESSHGKIKGPKFNMPKISGPKISMPDMDFSLKGPKLKGDMDVSVPEVEGDRNLGKIDIEGPDVETEGIKGGFKMPTIKMPSFSGKGPKVEGPDVDVSLPKADIDIKAPEMDIKGTDVDIKGPSGKMKGPKFNMPTISGPKISMPDVDFNLKGPKLKGDVDVSVPEVEGDIKAPKLDIPDVDVEGAKGGFKMPKIKMPSFSGEGPKVEGPDVNVSLPTADIDFTAPEMEIKGTDVDIKSPSGKIKGPKFNMPTISGPKISMPDVDINQKNLKVKGDMDASDPKFDRDVKGPNAGFDADLNKSGVTFPKFKGPKFATKSAELEGSESTVKTPKFSVGVKGSKTKVTLPETETSLDAPSIDINLKGKKGKFKLPKVKGNAKKPNVDIETPALDEDLETPNIHVKGTKAKKPLFGKLHFPGVELDIKSPKVKSDTSLSERFKSHDIDLPSASLNTDSANVCLEEPDVKVKTPDIKMSGLKGGPEVNASVSGGTATGGLQYPEGTVKFPKLKVPKFGIALPQMEGQETGGKVETELAASSGINVQSPSFSYQVSSQNIDVPSPELRQREGKVKVKMPKLFGKSKAKGSSVGDLTGPEAELTTGGKLNKVSASSVHSGELMSGKFELEGDPGLSVSTKGKSASLDLFKKSRHRSSSLSDEGGLAASSPSAHLEAEGGDISLDLGGGKVKGKKGKLKFGTFGGFGSKSKGSYEVTLGDSEAGEEGGVGVSLPSKKSRLSSSSSSDSGSRGGFRFPRLELSMSPKK